MKAKVLCMLAALTLSAFSAAAVQSANYNLHGSFVTVKSTSYTLSGSMMASISESSNYRLVSSLWWYESYPYTAGVSYKLGDMDGDGDVDFNDLIAVLNLILSGGYDSRADMDGNGVINFNDLIGVLNVILAGG